LNAETESENELVPDSDIDKEEISGLVDHLD
jgi:hypothetical protein